MTVFHGLYIYAFQFTLLNGVINTYGSITNAAIKNKTLIILEMEKLILDIMNYNKVQI